MSSAENQDSPAQPADGKKVFKRRGFQIFGLGLQDVIRFFFSGNASLAIIILILICFFLAKEAFLFFPDHHKDLKSYRQSGQEFCRVYFGRGLKRTQISTALPTSPTIQR